MVEINNRVKYLGQRSFHHYHLDKHTHTDQTECFTRPSKAVGNDTRHHADINVCSLMKATGRPRRQWVSLIDAAIGSSTVVSSVD